MALRLAVTDVFATIVIAVAATYAVVVCAFAAGASRLRRASLHESHLNDDALPRAAVVIAARNEEGPLPRCLDALLRQDYPADRLLIVVVDDHSTDGTAAVLQRYTRDVRVAVPQALAGDGGHATEVSGTFSGDGLPSAVLGPRIISIHAPDAGTLRGKAAALHAGIQEAAGFDAEVVAFTDADCAPPPGWCRAMASRLGESGVGLVCGRTEVGARKHGPAPMREAAEALDWTFLLTAAAVLTEYVRPATGMGNNMAIRRAVYEQIGGYHGVRFSVTEDHALFHAVVTRTSWRARFPLEPAMAVQTLPLRGVGEMYGQRRRWARGGLLAGPMLFVLYALTYFGQLAPLFAIGCAVAGTLHVGGALAIVASKLAADFVFFRSAVAPERRWLLRGFLAAEGWLTLYFTTIPPTLLAAPRINWKGRKH
jgi:cellulose synthase/poly-beta-1,6-N-acetylglucosamine synthase-like glycosyltransferase